MENNIKEFREYMCGEDCQFETVKKQLGEFNAVTFYLQQFEIWLQRKSAKTAPKNTSCQHEGSIYIEHENMGLHVCFKCGTAY